MLIHSVCGRRVDVMMESYEPRYNTVVCAAEEKSKGGDFYALRL